MKQYQNKQYLAISAIWYERYLEGTRTYKTSEFPDSVDRFCISLVDLDCDNEELAIDSKVNKFIKEDWEPRIYEMVNRITRHTSDPGVIDFERQQIIAQHKDEVFKFIIQTIQDSGIGWNQGHGGKGYDVSSGYRDQFTE